LSHYHRAKSPTVSGAGSAVALALVVWFVLVFSLGLGEVFVTPGDTPPVALLIAVTAPVILFLTSVWASSQSMNSS
jgi:hypothetical protein